MANAPAYIHEQVYQGHGVLTDRADMAAQLDAMLSVVGDIDAEIQFLAVDLEKQQVALRYILNTVLVKPFGGMEPNGKKVAIPANCFYQFVNGKIFAMWTALDMLSVRMQMAEEDAPDG